jgi:hypothetical protein
MIDVLQTTVDGVDPDLVDDLAKGGETRLEVGDKLFKGHPARPSSIILEGRLSGRAASTASTSWSAAARHRPTPAQATR